MELSEIQSLVNLSKGAFKLNMPIKTVLIALICTPLLTSCNGDDLAKRISESEVARDITDATAALSKVVSAKLAKYLSPEDQKNTAQSTVDAANGNGKSTWKNPETGFHGEAKVKKTETRRQDIQIKVAKSRVKETPPIEAINETFVVTAKSNLRGGPSTDYVIVDSLEKGTVVTVVGKVIGKKWYLLSTNGVGSGFIYASLVKPAPGAKEPEAPEQEQQQNVDDDVVEVVIASGQTCKIITQTVFLDDGAEQSDEVTVCQTGNGNWELV